MRRARKKRRAAENDTPPLRFSQMVKNRSFKTVCELPCARDPPWGSTQAGVLYACCVEDRYAGFTHLGRTRTGHEERHNRVLDGESYIQAVCFSLVSHGHTRVGFWHTRENNCLWSKPHKRFVLFDGTHAKKKKQLGLLLRIPIATSPLSPGPPCPCV